MEHIESWENLSDDDNFTIEDLTGWSDDDCPTEKNQLWPTQPSLRNTAPKATTLCPHGSKALRRITELDHQRNVVSRGLKRALRQNSLEGFQRTNHSFRGVFATFPGSQVPKSTFNLESTSPRPSTASRTDMTLSTRSPRNAMACKQATVKTLELVDQVPLRFIKTSVETEVGSRHHIFQEHLPRLGPLDDSYAGWKLTEETKGTTKVSVAARHRAVLLNTEWVTGNSNLARPIVQEPPSVLNQLCKNDKPIVRSRVGHLRASRRLSHASKHNSSQDCDVLFQANRPSLHCEWLGTQRAGGEVTNHVGNRGDAALLNSASLLQALARVPGTIPSKETSNRLHRNDCH